MDKLGKHFGKPSQTQSGIPLTGTHLDRPPRKSRCKYCAGVYTYFYGEAPGYCFRLDCIRAHIAEELAKLKLDS